MAILSDTAWEKHSNPWSGWTRTLSMPLLATGFYLHNWWIVAITIMWLIINPVFFSKPKKINNWMSKGVLGEKIYTQDRKYFKKDLPTLLNASNIFFFTLFIYFSWIQNLEAAILSGILVMVIKFWFIDRMVAVYDTQKS